VQPAVRYAFPKVQEPFEPNDVLRRSRERRDLGEPAVYMHPFIPLFFAFHAITKSGFDP
jgi:hypothetical protein